MKEKVSKETPNIENFKLLVDFLKVNFDEIQNRLQMANWFYDEDIGHISPYHVLDIYSIEGYRHICGTTACIAGWSYISGIPELTEEEYNMRDYIQSVFGIEYKSDIGRFVFHHYWPDDLSQAIKRIDYVIEHGKVPDDFCGNFQDLIM